MNLTALGFLGIFGAGIFLAFFRHPFFGLLAYLWVFYNPPPQRWWGVVLPDIRWSLIAGIVTLVAVLLHSSSKDTRASWYQNWGARLLLIWTIWLWIQNFWAVDPLRHLDGCILFTKYVLLIFLIYRLVVSKQDFEFFVLANVVGGLIFGWIAYQNPGSGRFESVGGPGVNDANTLSMHMAVLLVLAGFLFLGLKDWRKWIVVGCVPFILNAIILASSRSAILGLACGGLASLVLVPAVKRKALYGVGMLGVILLLTLGHDQFWDRMKTILPDEQGELEQSAQSRPDLLKIEWEMAKDFPLGVGVKGHGVVIHSYVPQGLSTVSKTQAAHNTFMAAFIEQGVPGAFYYLALWGWMGITVWRLKSLDQFGLNESLGLYRAGLGSALVILFVSGQFQNFLQAEIWIWLLALVSSFSVLCHQSIQGNSLVPSSAREAVRFQISSKNQAPHR